jgi:hypothetical protein
MRVYSLSLVRSLPGEEGVARYIDGSLEVFVLGGEVPVLFSQVAEDLATDVGGQGSAGAFSTGGHDSVLAVEDEEVWGGTEGAFVAGDALDVVVHDDRP